MAGKLTLTTLSGAMAYFSRSVPYHPSWSPLRFQKATRCIFPCLNLLLCSWIMWSGFWQLWNGWTSGGENELKEGVRFCKERRSTWLPIVFMSEHRADPQHARFSMLDEIVNPLISSPSMMKAAGRGARHLSRKVKHLFEFLTATFPGKRELKKEENWML